MIPHQVFSRAAVEKARDLETGAVMNAVNHLSQLESYARSTARPVATAFTTSANKMEEEEADVVATASSVVRISVESLRLMRQDATVISREEERNEALELYSRYEHRLNRFMRSFFTQDDKELLGKAYRLAEEKNVDLKKIDKLANELGSWRIRQYMAGELTLMVTGGDENKPKQVDLAHMAILGEMRKMGGESGIGRT
jgi:hypothetical protein